MKDFKFEDQFNVEEDQKTSIEEVSKKIESISQLARKCLTNGDFQRYKDLFEREKDAIINAMVVYTASFGKSGYENVNVYAFNMLRFVQQITDLRKLLTAVEMDARKFQQGESNGEN